MNTTLRRRMRLIGALLLASAVVQPLTVTPAAVATGGGCSEVSIPATKLGDSSTTYTVKGDLCLPYGETPDVVQLLVHGGTYNREYWDFGYQPLVYSYVKHANAAGYATLNIDRIGHGASTRPVSSDLGFANQAYVLHQVVQALRTNVNGKSFDWVQGVGHSLGSDAIAAEAATYGDLDSVILTGMAHVLSESGVANAQAQLYPANNETQWASLDSGYFTTVPGGRDDAFYYTPTMSAGVLAHDEATKDTLPLQELLELDVYNSTDQIDVPVLVVNGKYDSMVCGTGGTDCSSSLAMQNAEAPYFASAACMRAISVAATGHDVQLQQTALLSNFSMLAWTYLVTGGPSGSGGGCTSVQNYWITV